MNDALGSVQSVLVLGGGSDIALATAKALVAQRCRTVVLAGRDPESFAGATKELHARARRPSRRSSSTRSPTRRTPASSPDLRALRRHRPRAGRLRRARRPGARRARRHRGDPHRRDQLHRRRLGARAATDALRRQGHGRIVVLSSVAGERARRSNFVYGSSKAGLDAFCQGLGDSLAGTGVRLLVVRPGFVHSKMTQGLDAAPLATDPSTSPRRSSLGRGAARSSGPGPLRFVMSVLRHVPRVVFRRLPL